MVMGVVVPAPRVIAEMTPSMGCPSLECSPILVMVSRTEQPPRLRVSAAKAVLIDWLVAFCSDISPPTE